MTVNLARVNQLSGDLQNGSKDIAGILETLDGQVKTLIGSWEGAAQNSYHEAQKQWDASLKRINELLAKISTAVSTISGQYADTDKSNAARFGG
jgi:early secretory antigenic target protein ESAT-6